MMKLPEKIFDLRKRQGLSQEALAEKLHVSRQTVSRWETGSALPDAGNIVQLSRLFGITADELLDDGWDGGGAPPQTGGRPAPSKDRRRKRLALCLGAVGLLGNLVIYLLSRAIEVMVPMVTYQDGEKWYTWRTDLTGHSYRYFIQEYELTILVTVLWALVIAAIALLLLNRETIEGLRRRLAAKRRKGS